MGPYHLCMWVNPISIKYVHVDSMSRVTFSLDGTAEEAVTVIRSYSPNKAILWSSNHSMQLQEKWHLWPEPDGTLIDVVLGYDPTGWILGRLADKLLMRNKMKEAVLKMLDRLKAVAEQPEQV
ncbi:SRPBCC family protein [Chloroflexota bacterium]